MDIARPDFTTGSLQPGNELFPDMCSVLDDFPFINVFCMSCKFSANIYYVLYEFLYYCIEVLHLCITNRMY